MLKYRLIFGTLMVLLFLSLVIFDGWLDGSLTAAAENKPIQATMLCILIALIAIPSQLEISKLIGNAGTKVFKIITIPATILLASSWYVRQFFESHPLVFHLYYLLFILAFSVLGIFFLQARRHKTEGVIANCSAGVWSILYVGFLSAFFLGIRIDFGLWEFLMFVLVVKSSDIGAYTVGRICGKHKFAPNISPGKTWEGIAGGIVFASIVALLFAHYCDIMAWYLAIGFGVVFAFCGQLGDLAESMIKRDAAQKDSASSVPGFGGLLDIVDSPLATAPLAYLFLMLIGN
jgi:phosphatidate cytidylyltransferase